MRPRLTKRVLRGLQLVAQNARTSLVTTGSPIDVRTDLGTALLWIDGMLAWQNAPRRKGKVPPQLRRALRRR